MTKSVYISFIAIAAILSCSTNQNDDLAAGKKALVVLTVLQARNAGKSHEVDTLYADNARVWYERKSGEGVPLSTGGTGPWAEWDRFFKAKSIDQNIKAYDDSVVVYQSELNDFYRLIERKPKPMAITYYFNDSDKITGRLVVGVKTVPAPTDRFDEAVDWLRRQYPDDLTQLMPDGEIKPSLENAALWKKRLNEWRISVKLDTI